MSKRLYIELEEVVDQKVKLLAAKTKRSRKAIVEYIVQEQVEKLLEALENK